MKKAPKSIWIIFDPLDGPHIFKTETEAIATYKKWEKEATSTMDSFWDMIGPIEYTIIRETKKD